MSRKVSLIIGLIFLFSIASALAITNTAPVCVSKPKEVLLQQTIYPANNYTSLIFKTDISENNWIDIYLDNKNLGKCKTIKDGSCTFIIEKGLKAGLHYIETDYLGYTNNFQINVKHNMKVTAYGSTNVPAGTVEFTVLVTDDEGNVLNYPGITLLVYKDSKAVENVDNVGGGTGYSGNWLIKDFVPMSTIIRYTITPVNKNNEIDYYSNGEITQEIKTYLGEVSINSPESNAQLEINKTHKVVFTVTDEKTGKAPEEITLSLIEIKDSKGRTRTSQFSSGFKQVFGEQKWELSFKPDEAEDWIFKIKAEGRLYNTKTESIKVSVWETDGGDGDGGDVTPPESFWDKYGTYVIIGGVVLVLLLVGYWMVKPKGGRRRR